MGNSMQIKPGSSVDPVTSVTFTLNGEQVTVEGASVQTRLQTWLHEQPGLKGTKVMCAGGGCGCCVVAATRIDPASGMEETVAINSCLCPLYSVGGWHITTVEGIGSSTKGFHPIQQKVAEHNASQCGYCTPGFVMNMYSLLQQTQTPSRQQIEDHFDGNICRCTGYRPILDAMKSFAVDTESSDDMGFVDIEDLVPASVCPKTGKLCVGGTVHKPCHQAKQSSPKWYKPSSLNDLFAIVATYPDSKIKFIAGDTGRGVFGDAEDYDVYIDLKGITELYQTEVSVSSLAVGGAIPLSRLITLLQNNEGKSSSFEHLAAHILKVANYPVRNVGTWAGNITLTHNNNNFPSDVFTIMAAVGASVTVAALTSSSAWSYSTMSLWDFLSYNVKNSVIVKMDIPFAPSDAVFRSFKIMPRAQSAHAYVNAAFLMEVEPSTLTVKGKPSLVYGGIGTHSVAASETAAYLEGKSLVELSTLQGALDALGKEINPNSPPAAASPEYRKSLAISLFYKFYLAAIGGHISPRVKSASVPFKRPISEGSQSYSTQPSEYPVTEPMTKLTALLQASGEAEYTTDIPVQAGELAAAFVLTTQGNAKITNMDFSAAEQMPGFVKILTADDIPGENLFYTKPFIPPGTQPEALLASDFSEYAGMPVAVVIADTRHDSIAIAAAAAAGVQYESVGKPIITTQDAIAAGSFFDNPGASPISVGDAKAAIEASANVVKGTISMGTQYHFYMETQTTLCVPLDDGFQIHSSTQWSSLTQAAVSNVLGIPNNIVNISTKRVGGAYGGKITRASWIAAGTALASSAVRRPVRMHMDLDTNMKMVGKRFPYYASYTVGCTHDGVLNGIDVTVYSNCGFNGVDSSIFMALAEVDNAYHVPNWKITPVACKTNTCSNTPTRSPGTLPGTFISEAMLDHVATALGLPVEEVKRKNLYQKDQVTPTGMTLKYCSLSSLWDQLLQSSDFVNRKAEVDAFNKANRWRKRGITMVPLRFAIVWDGAPYSCQVSIYQKDGTVAIAHGGVEMGQGINTKVAQVAAKFLGVPLDMVKIKPTNTLIGPNDVTTGGSIGSELNCLGVMNACKELNTRIAPIKEKHPSLTWVELIRMCYSSGIDLGARSFVFEKTNTFVYNSYGVTCTEVELDVLTGQSQILRVDILYDCGESINPEIDIGQVEGAFVMGLGYWMTEKVIYDEDSGELLTHNTWEYFPPSSHDIPIDFRVELLKNTPNPVGVLGSKASGEPPLCMSCSALFAVKRAIESARAEIGNDDQFTLNGPATVDAVQQLCLVEPSQFSL